MVNIKKSLKRLICTPRGTERERQRYTRYPYRRNLPQDRGPRPRTVPSCELNRNRLNGIGSGFMRTKASCSGAGMVVVGDRDLDMVLARQKHFYTAHLRRGTLARAQDNLTDHEGNSAALHNSNFRQKINGTTQRRLETREEDKETHNHEGSTMTRSLILYTFPPFPSTISPVGRTLYY